MNELIQKSYAFVLGREVELAKTELEAVLNRFGFCFGERSDCYLDEEETLAGGETSSPCSSFYTLSLAGNVALINIESTTLLDPKAIINELGGTVKIFELIGPRSSNLAGQVFEVVFAKKAGDSKKFNFGISSYSRGLDQRNINKAGLEVKRMFEGTLKTRFVALREGKELSSILSLKNKLVNEGVEVGVFPSFNPRGLETPGVISGGLIGVLVALSDPEEWSKRDYDKPAGDKRSGMVPPKLARMLVNIALGLQARNSNNQLPTSNQEPNSNDQLRTDAWNLNEHWYLNIKNCLVVDPFCGSGNILMEAMLLGCDVVGSDVSEKAVNDTRANIAWLLENYESRIKNQGGKTPFKIFQSDATSEEFVKNLDFVSLIPDSSVAVVTEPYLGEPKRFAPSLKAAQGEYAKVKNLYLSFLSNLSYLGKEVVFCIIFPLVETSEGKKYSLYQESVDEIKKLGYTELRTPLIYGRDYQVVKREIAFLGLK